MASLMPNGKQQYTTSTGAPLSGGKVFAYAAGTNTPKATYTDQSGNVANTNPVILNARGEAAIWWVGNYKVVVKDALDNLIYTSDNYHPVSETQGTEVLAQLAEPTGASLVGGAVQTLNNYSEIRSYTGSAKSINISSPGISGTFLKTNRVGAVDNNGTTIVSSNGNVWERSDQSIINVSFFEINDASSQSSNFTNLGNAISSSIDSGALDLVVNTVADVSETTPFKNKANTRCTGSGYLRGVYRKGVIPVISKYANPIVDCYSKHFTFTTLSASPVIAIMGDSISTEGPDMNSSTLSMWSLIKQRVLSCNSNRTPIFYNRAIGGQTWTNANTKPTAFPLWYTDTSKSWLSYIESIQPDVVFLAFGMNDSNGFNAGTFVSTVNKIKAFQKVPVIVFITNPVPSLAALYPDGAGFGYVTQPFQEGRDFVAGFVRNYAKFFGHPLIDINRYQDMSRDGFDPCTTSLQFIQTVNKNSHVSADLTRDFCYKTVVDISLYNQTKAIQIKAGLDPEDAIYVVVDSGKFKVQGFCEYLNTYIIVETGVPVPTTDFILDVSVSDNVCVLFINDVCAATFKLIRHGGLFLPFIQYQGEISGPFKKITFLSGNSFRYKQSISDSDLWGASDNTPDMKQPYGGNGINHPTTVGLEKLFKPMIEAAELFFLRAPPDQSNQLILLEPSSSAVSSAVLSKRYGNIVSLCGNVRNIGSGRIAVIVNPQHFPLEAKRVCCYSNNNINFLPAFVVVNTNGDITLEAGSSAVNFVSLDNITYVV